MRSIRSRIERLEQRSDVEQQEGLQFVLMGVQTRMALDSQACIEILKKFGFVRRPGMSILNFLNVPDGLSEAELKQYLRDHAEEICK